MMAMNFHDLKKKVKSKDDLKTKMMKEKNPMFGFSVDAQQKMQLRIYFLNKIKEMQEKMMKMKLAKIQEEKRIIDRNIMLKGLLDVVVDQAMTRGDEEQRALEIACQSQLLQDEIQQEWQQE